MLCHRTGRGGQCTCLHHFSCSTKSFRSSGPPRRARWYSSPPGGTPATIECGSPTTILSVPQRPFVTTGLYLKRQVIRSARMEALMQHYQAAGFSREVSKFAAAPTCRRPSTNRMYDDRWLRFTTWDTGRGFDQTIKGYRSCLASVLSRTGRAAEV